LDNINNGVVDGQIEIKCCKKCLKLINIIYNSFLEKHNIKEKNYKINIYYLFNNTNINKLINTESNKEDGNNINEQNHKLKKIISNIAYLNLVNKLLSYLSKSINQSLQEYCFKILIDLLTTNELLSNEIKRNDDIKKNFSLLINNNIISPFNNDKFFIQSLITYINGLSNNIKDLTSLAGIGRKSANVIMLEVFGKAYGIAVDTHCKRIANRLELSKQKDPLKIEQDLLMQIDPIYYKDVNHLFIWHRKVYM
jgi:endonuclease III